MALSDLAGKMAVKELKSLYVTYMAWGKANMAAVKKFPGNIKLQKEWRAKAMSRYAEARKFHKELCRRGE